MLMELAFCSGKGGLLEVSYLLEVWGKRGWVSLM